MEEKSVKKIHQNLLVVDGIVNLLLGVLLLLVPLGMAQVLGLPSSDQDFYPVILGGVLFGIGVALLIERYGNSRGIRGLGLAGAMAINFCGAAVLLVCLVWGGLDLPTRGAVLLWSVVVLVFGIGIAELAARPW
jgi:hypothetical protein